MLLAIDPGYKNMGYCVGHLDTLNVTTSGTIVTRNKTFPDQLLELYTNLSTLINTHKITTLVYEKPTYAVGHDTGNKVQQAIGILLCVSAYHDIRSITTYTPSEIKKLLTKDGKADKYAIQLAVLNQLPNIQFKTHHESDAIGMYICYVNSIFK
jgi:crossover junction endodeoxyribonuclease RuvC